ncbi:MAG: hypothetical protein AB7O56_04890 [Bauldia sp.]
MARMNTKLQEMLERVKTWPQERQEDAARILSEVEEQDDRSPQISDDQAAEVERRLRDPDPQFLSLAEVRARFARRGA